MKKPRFIGGSTIKLNQSYEGESIEVKVRRLLTNKEPIKDGAPLTYSERNDGVKPSNNIKTDRWEHAVEAMDKVTRSHIAKREARHKKPEGKKVDNPGGAKPEDAKGESTQATE